MQGITDRDVAYDILISTKCTAAGYSHAASEAASPSCYRTFMELHERTQEIHRRIWEYLHRRQEYRVSEAHPQEIQSVRERMDRLRDDHLRGEYVHGETARDNRGWDERRRDFEPAGAGRAGSAFRGTEWNSGQLSGGTSYGGGAAPGGTPYGGAGYNYNTTGGGAAWERPGERRFEPAPRY